MCYIPYSRKLSREKTFTNFVVVAIHKSFARELNLGMWHPLAQQKRAIRESFLRENRIFHQFMKIFSLKILMFPAIRYLLNYQFN